MKVSRVPFSLCGCVIAVEYLVYFYLESKLTLEFIVVYTC